MRHCATILTMLLAGSSNALAAQDRPAAPAKPKQVRDVLDVDRDGVLSASEIVNAPLALRSLDSDADGALSRSEFEGPTTRGMRGRRGGRQRFGGRMGGNAARGNPLDENRDGRIDAAEILGATQALRALDGNRDGQLSAREFDYAFPKPDAHVFDMGSMMRGGRNGGTTRRTVLPQELEIKDGTAHVPDRATFETLAYRGENVMIDTHLRNLEFVKFQIEKAGTEDAQLYFLNTKTWRAHPAFMGAMGLARGRRGGRGGGDPATQTGGAQMRGVLVYRPMLRAPNGDVGLYTFEFEPNDAYPFALIKFAYDMLSEKSKLLRNRLAYHPLNRAISRYEDEKAQYDAAKLPGFLPKDLLDDIAFLPLHSAKSFGRLRLMKLGERPNARDIVLYETLPNEMPRVAGIITGVRQTPLSHVNLRAVQDDVPNAFIKGAAQNSHVRKLLGKYVAYEVTDSGYALREASVDEVEKHFASIRPVTAQTPRRNLEVREVRTLGEIQPEDWPIYGVKATNLAVLRSLDLPAKTIKVGFAIPFAYYDAFMKHNGFYQSAREMREAPDFASDTKARRKALAKLRKSVRKGAMPDWMTAGLTKLQTNFGAGASIRCRSSTNNEDLPKFSGAGLYDSFTHKPGEGHLSKTVRQVWASLWNFRAYEEREFYRIDHFETAMGVLAHPNFEGEIANGVAVSSDVVYQTENMYYVNTQVGEDLVTNPDATSTPEEVLLSPRDFRGDRIVRYACASENKALLSGVHMDDLRESLSTIDAKFRKIYGLSPRALFAIEVEFKVTKKKRLVIKQARPWIF